jgi:hypothetical protein
MTGQVRIAPQTFAVDDKTGQGLVIFETLKSKTKFSVHMSNSLEIGLFLSESFKREESGYHLSKKIFEKLGYSVDRGSICGLEGEREEVQLVLRDQDGELEKVNVGLLELLGLWSTKSFPLFASKKFIESCRDVKIEIKETGKPLKSDLYKRYGQKYLM